MINFFETAWMTMHLGILIFTFYKLLYWSIFRIRNTLWMRTACIFLLSILVLLLQSADIRLYYIYHKSRTWVEQGLLPVLSFLMAVQTRIVVKKENAGRTLNVDSVQEAMDSIHVGICICKPSGTPVLVNEYMYQLVLQLTGKSLLNANLLWDKLEHMQLESEEVLERRNLGDLTGRMESNELYVISMQERIYRFRKYRISNQNGEFTEIMATDITKTASLISDIHEQNLRLNEQNHIRYAEVKRRFELNKSKELLRSKIGLHQKLGEAIFATRSVILGEKSSTRKS